MLLLKMRKLELSYRSNICTSNPATRASTLFRREYEVLFASIGCRAAETRRLIGRARSVDKTYLVVVAVVAAVVVWH
jgi:hypothetical protein